MKKPFEIEFENLCEIRMGSPFKTCSLKFHGGSEPPLINKNDFQDLYIWNCDNSLLALVKWDVLNNNPGFKFFIYNNKTHSIIESNRYEGCCKSIEFKGNELLFKSTLNSDIQSWAIQMN